MEENISLPPVEALLDTMKSMNDKAAQEMNKRSQLTTEDILPPEELHRIKSELYLESILPALNLMQENILKTVKIQHAEVMHELKKDVIIDIDRPPRNWVGDGLPPTDSLLQLRNRTKQIVQSVRDHGLAMTPLTPEVLIAVGFTDCDGDFYRISIENTIDLDLDIFPDGTYRLWSVRESDEEAYWIGSIKRRVTTLEQLRSLYYGLTGERLPYVK